MSPVRVVWGLIWAFVIILLCMCLWIYIKKRGINKKRQENHCWAWDEIPPHCFSSLHDHVFLLLLPAPLPDSISYCHHKKTIQCITAEPVSYLLFSKVSIVFIKICSDSRLIRIQVAVTYFTHTCPHWDLKIWEICALCWYSPSIVQIPLTLRRECSQRVLKSPLGNHLL